MANLNSCLVVFIVCSLFIRAQCYSSVDSIAPLPNKVYLTPGEQWSLDLNEYFVGYNLTFSISASGENKSETGGSAVTIRDPFTVKAEGRIAGLPNSTVVDWIFPQAAASSSVSYFPGDKVYALTKDNMLYSGNSEILSAGSLSFEVQSNLSAVVNGSCSNLGEIYEYILVECATFDQSKNQTVAAFVLFEKKTGQLVNYHSLEISDSDFIQTIPSHILLQTMDPDTWEYVLVLMDPQNPTIAMVFELKDQNGEQPFLSFSYNITASTFNLSSLFIVSIETLEHHILILDEKAGPLIFSVAKSDSGKFVTVPGYQYYKFMTSFVSPSGIIVLFLGEENDNCFYIHQLETNSAFLTFNEASIYIIADFNSEKSPKSARLLSVYPSDSFITVLLSFCSYTKSYCDLEFRIVENGKGFGHINDVFAERVLGSEDAGLMIGFNSYWNVFLLPNTQSMTFEAISVSGADLLVQNLTKSETIDIHVVSSIGPDSVDATIELIALETTDFSIYPGDSTSYNFGCHYPLPDVFPYSFFLHGYVEDVDSNEFKATIRSVDKVDLGEINVLPMGKKLGTGTTETFSRVFALGGKQNNGDVAILTQVSDSTGRYYTNLAYCIDNFPEGIRAREETPRCFEMVSFEGSYKVTDAFVVNDLMIIFEEGEANIDVVKSIQMSIEDPQVNSLKLPFSCLPQGVQQQESEDALICLDNLSTPNRLIFLFGYSLVFETKEKMVYREINLPSFQRFFNVWMLPDFDNDFLLLGQDGSLYLTNALYLDNNRGALIYVKLEELQSSIEGSYSLTTSADRVIIKNYNKNSIQEFKFDEKTNFFVLIHDMPLFDCKLIQEINPTKVAKGLLYSLAKCNNIGDIDTKGATMLLVHSTEKTYHDSFRGYYQINSEGMTIPSTIQLTSAYVPFVNLNMVLVSFVQYNSTAGESLAVLNSFWVYPEAYLEVLYSGLEPYRENWFEPAFYVYTETFIEFMGLTGEPVQFSGNFTVTNYMNRIKVNPENNLTEWKSQLISTETKEEMVLKVNYSAFIKSHISSTQADCAAFQSANGSQGTIVPITCEKGNGVYVPNQVNYGVFLWSMNLLNTRDVLSMTFDSSNRTFVTVSINASHVEVAFEWFNPDAESDLINLEVQRIDFSKVLPSENYTTVDCKKILWDSTPVRPGSELYVLCQDTRMTGYYLAVLTLNGTDGWLKVDYVNSLIPVHSGRVFKAFNTGIIGVISDEYSPLTDQTAASRLFLYSVEKSNGTFTLSEFIVINPYRIKLETFSLIDFTLFPVYSSFPVEIVEKYHLFLLLGDQPANSTFYCLDLEPQSQQVKFFRALGSPVEQKLISSWTSIDIADKYEKYWPSKSDFNILVSSTLGGSYVMDAKISLTNSSLAENYLEVVTAFVDYGGFLIEEAKIGDEFAVLRSGSSLFIYPRHFYCDKYDMSESDYSSCVEYSSQINMIGEIQFKEFNDMGSLVGFSILEGRGWDSRCVSHLLIALSNELHNGDRFINDGEILYVCLSEYITVTYDNVTSAAWMFSFKNFFGSQETFVYFHVQEGEGFIFYILLFIGVSGVLGLAGGVAHFFWRRTKISSARKDMGTIQDSYRRFEEQGRANDFPSRDSSNSSMLSSS